MKVLPVVRPRAPTESSCSMFRPGRSRRRPPSPSRRADRDHTTHTSCWTLVQDAPQKVVATYEISPDVTFSVAATINFLQVSLGDATYSIYYKAGKCPLAA
jgi:hypothetical protein